MKVLTRSNDPVVCHINAHKQTRAELTENSASTRVGVCNEQPLPLSTLPSLPAGQTCAFAKGDEHVDPFWDESHRSSNVLDQPPSLKPLDFGDSLPIRWPYSGKQKDQSSHASRPSISAPYNFRRLDHNDAQKQSLVPLRLGPVILRESPVPGHRHTPTALYTEQNSVGFNTEPAARSCQVRVLPS